MGQIRTCHTRTHTYTYIYIYVYAYLFMYLFSYVYIYVYTCGVHDQVPVRSLAFGDHRCWWGSGRFSSVRNLAAFSSCMASFAGRLTGLATCLAGASACLPTPQVSIPVAHFLQDGWKWPRRDMNIAWFAAQDSEEESADADRQGREVRDVCRGWAD